LYLAGNHSHYHCGSNIVWNTIKKYLKKKHIELVPTLEDSDSLLINGEGSMHHGSRGFMRKMNLLEKAQLIGKNTFLINTVWMKNPSLYDSVLRNINQIVCRDLFSCEDLQKNHGVDSSLAPDLSCLSMTSEERLIFLESLGNRNNQMIFTDFYASDFEGWVQYTACKFKDFKTVDMSKISWISLLSLIGQSRLVVTGRFHMVCACLLTKTPFVALKSNSHKIEGMAAACDSSLPVADSPIQLKPLVESALEGKFNKSYQNAFSWIDSYTLENVMPF